MLTRTCTFNGDVILELNEKLFIIYPVKDNKKFSIIYDITMDKYKEEKLLLRVLKEKGSPASHIITVEKSTIKQLEIFVEATNLIFDPLEREICDFKKTIHIFNTFKLQTYGGFVETIYQYNDRSSHTVFTNLETNIHKVNNWFCKIWPPKSQCTEYCITIKDQIIGESQTLVSQPENSKVNIEVAERCYIGPITEDSLPIVIPWNKNVQTMLKHSSVLLEFDIAAIRLLDKNRNELDVDSMLDVRDFRIVDSIEVPRLFYDIPTSKMTVESMRSDQDNLEILIIKDQTVSDIKRKLGFKMRIEERRFIICRDEMLLPNSEVISICEKLKYCMSPSAKDIISKKLLGHGSYGSVYECTNKSSIDSFALKEFAISFDEWKTCSVISEMVVLITVTQAIRNEDGGFSINIVQYLDLYIDNNKIGIAMEYAPGGSLTKYLEQSGPLDESEIRKYSKDILNGLKYLHQIKIMHRDIKGPNVLLCQNNVAKLSDFGISKILTNYSTRKLSDGIKRTSEIGSVRWMAPEIITNKKYGLKVDIWSVGATVVEMITGRVPFYTIIEEAAIYFKVANLEVFEFDPPKPLSKELHEFVYSCLVVENEKRLNVHKLLELDFFK